MTVFPKNVFYTPVFSFSGKRGKDTTIDNKQQEIKGKLSRFVQLFIASKRKSFPFLFLKCLFSVYFISALKKKFSKSNTSVAIKRYASAI